MTLAIYFWTLIVLGALAEINSVSAEPKTCKDTALGMEYTGRLAFTKNGKKCQAWASQSPHSHTRNVAHGAVFPDGDEVKAENFCRNIKTPDETSDGPWCYTTDNDVRWEYCAVPTCTIETPKECIDTVQSFDYAGHLSVTKSGKVCQAWSSQTPHKHTYTTASGVTFPDGNDVSANNYCRSVMKPGEVDEAPWCYTTDPNVRWEYCAVPLCKDVPAKECKDTVQGWEYAGLKSVTKSGHTCQAWASQTPNTHTANTANGRTFPDGNDVSAGNHCRNPDGTSGGPWCYTKNTDVRWEYCSIEAC